MPGNRRRFSDQFKAQAVLDLLARAASQAELGPSKRPHHWSQDYRDCTDE